MPRLIHVFTNSLNEVTEGGPQKLLLELSARLPNKESLLADLRALGVDETLVQTSMPLPETLALIAYAHYQICRLNPMGLLGHLYFLDSFASEIAPPLRMKLFEVGINPDAMNFLRP